MTPRLIALLLAVAASAACGAREDPARAALRERLGNVATLSAEELARFRAEITRTIEGKTFLQQGLAPAELDPEQRAIVFGMLTDPAGLFDEGIRREHDATFRVLNAPGQSANPEIEASRRLWVDIETFLPRRFEFAHAFQGPDDYAFDLTLQDEN